MDESFMSSFFMSSLLHHTTISPFFSVSESDFCPEQAAKVTRLSVAMVSVRIFHDFSFNHSRLVKQGCEAIKIS